MMRYLVDSAIGADRIGGRNDSVVIPVGTIFARVTKTRVDGDNMNLESVDLGNIASVAIRLVGVEHFGHPFDYVPADHSPLLFVDGDAVARLSTMLDACSDREYLGLIPVPLVVSRK